MSLHYKPLSAVRCIASTHVATRNAHGTYELRYTHGLDIKRPGQACIQ